MKVLRLLLQYLKELRGRQRNLWVIVACFTVLGCGLMAIANTGVVKQMGDSLHKILFCCGLCFFAIVVFLLEKQKKSYRDKDE